MSQRRSYSASAERRRRGSTSRAGWSATPAEAPRSSQRFDPARDGWTTLAPLPGRCRAASRRPRSADDLRRPAATTPSGGGRQVVRVRRAHAAPGAGSRRCRSRSSTTRPSPLGGTHLRPRRLRPRPSNARRLRLRPGANRWRAVPPLPRAQHALRRGRLPRRALDDRRPPRRPDPALGLDATTRPRALARRAAAAEADGAARRDRRRRAGPCGLGAHLPRLRRADAAAGARARAAGAAARARRCSRSPGGCTASAAAPSTCTTARSSRCGRSSLRRTRGSEPLMVPRPEIPLGCEVPAARTSLWL